MKKRYIFIMFIFICTISLAEEFHDFRGFTDVNGNTQLYYRKKDSIYSYHALDLTAHLFKLDISSMEEGILVESQSGYFGQPGDHEGNVFHDYILNDESGYSTINCGTDFMTPVFLKSFIRLDFMEYLFWDGSWEPPKYFVNIKRSNIYSPIIYTTYWYDFNYYLIKSSDGGANWTSVENAPSYILRGISPFDDQFVFCATSNGELYRSENGTTSTILVDDTSYLDWSQYRMRPSSNYSFHHFTSHLQFLFDQDEQHIYAIETDAFGNTYHLMRSEDNGFNWDVISTDYLPIFIDVDMTNSGVLYKCVGSDIFKSLDYGDTFTPFQSLPDDIGGIYQVDNTDTLYAVTHNSLYEVTNNSLELLILLPTSNDENTIPQYSFKMNNYPNPFNPSTTISFSIQTDSNIDLSIYNLSGQKIKNLVHNEYTKGSHSIIWNGVDEFNKPVSSGVYFYKLNVNSKSKSVKKCLLLK